MLAAGEILENRYTIERTLGRGGMGAVYLARDATLGDKLVAVKEIIVHIEDPAERERSFELFKQEATLLGQLDHPNIVQVTHYFGNDEKKYIVMAYVDGTTLEAAANKVPGFLKISLVMQWVDDICDVLDYLHKQKPPIVFRDLKPSNIMLDARDRIRLIDFGIARIFDPQGKTATLIKGAGTPGFAPLEQYGATTGSADVRADIYALGATIYALLTKTIPPAAADIATGADELHPPQEINPEVPPALAAVVLKLMALRREDRYQSVEEARQALQLAATSLSHEDSTDGLEQTNCIACFRKIPAGAPSCPHCGRKFVSGWAEKAEPFAPGFSAAPVTVAPAAPASPPPPPLIVEPSPPAVVITMPRSGGPFLKLLIMMLPLAGLALGWTFLRGGGRDGHGPFPNETTWAHWKLTQREGNVSFKDKALTLVYDRHNSAGVFMTRTGNIKPRAPKKITFNVLCKRNPTFGISVGQYALKGQDTDDGMTFFWVQPQSSWGLKVLAAQDLCGFAGPVPKSAFTVTIEKSHGETYDMRADMWRGVRSVIVDPGEGYQIHGENTIRKLMQTDEWPVKELQFICNGGPDQATVQITDMTIIEQP